MGNQLIRQTNPYSLVNDDGSLDYSTKTLSISAKVSHSY